jgi:hypothetical protein
MGDTFIQGGFAGSGGPVGFDRSDLGLGDGSILGLKVGHDPA